VQNKVKEIKKTSITFIEVSIYIYEKLNIPIQSIITIPYRFPKKQAVSDLLLFLAVLAL